MGPRGQLPTCRVPETCQGSYAASSDSRSHSLLCPGPTGPAVDSSCAQMVQRPLGGRPGPALQGVEWCWHFAAAGRGSALSGCLAWLKAPALRLLPGVGLCSCRLPRGGLAALQAGGLASRCTLLWFVRLGLGLFSGSEAPRVQQAHVALGLPGANSDIVW